MRGPWFWPRGNHGLVESQPEVYYCLGPAKNAVLLEKLGRVIGKAEVMPEGENPRFIVINLPAKGFKDQKDKSRFSPPRLYGELDCARGDMENELK